MRASYKQLAHSAFVVVEKSPTPKEFRQHNLLQYNGKKINYFAYC
jgi:hypothetical protein